MSYTVNVPPGFGKRLSFGATTLNCVKSDALLATLSVTRNPPKMRRKYANPTDTRGMTCCCTPVENSQFQGRTPRPLSVAGSFWVPGTRLPNVLVSHGPHSPFSSGFVRTQSGTLLRLRSFTVRAVVVMRLTAGFRASAVASDSCATPRATLALMAVLPSPKRSYETPARGLISFQFTTFAPGNDWFRVGRNLVGPAVYGSYDSFCTSYRSAPLSVMRLRVHRSWM